jgi:phospholipid/cholesterol/gamma-HCH transport system substrate-binding protein
MRLAWHTGIKFGAFAVAMALLTAALFLIFGQYRTGSTTGYSAVFLNVSRLKPGDSVRVAGVKVGAVDRVSLRDDKKVLVTFNADRKVVLTTGTRAMVRYLNLVGDRYLDVVDGPGSTRALPAGSQIPPERTAPALDLNLLLGGLKPVIRGLNPQDVNALSTSLIQILQGQGDTTESLFAQTSSLTNTLADHHEVVGQLIQNLRTLLATLSHDGNDISATIDRLQRVVSGFSADRDLIGDAIESLDKGTASLTDLLTAARPPLAGTVAQLSRLAPALDLKKDRVDAMLTKLPEDYHKLARVGSYGSFLNYYVCSLSFRVTDMQGRTAVFPMVYQESGRCAEPKPEAAPKHD